MMSIRYAVEVQPPHGQMDEGGAGLASNLFHWLIFTRERRKWPFPPGDALDDRPDMVHGGGMESCRLHVCVCSLEAMVDMQRVDPVREIVLRARMNGSGLAPFLDYGREQVQEAYGVRTT